MAFRLGKDGCRVCSVDQRELDPGSGQIVVRLRLQAGLALEPDTPTEGDVLAIVDLDPSSDPDELDYPHATAGLSESNAPIWARLRSPWLNVCHRTPQSSSILRRPRMA